MLVRSWGHTPSTVTKQVSKDNLREYLSNDSSMVSVSCWFDVVCMGHRLGDSVEERFRCRRFFLKMHRRHSSNRSNRTLVSYNRTDVPGSPDSGARMVRTLMPVKTSWGSQCRLLLLGAVNM